MKFSIIVPVYNVEDYLEKCLDSILNQTYKNFEIIVINDGSTDNSVDILKNYKQENIKIINQNNSGLSIARNEGVKKATGDYILFVDSDDYIDKELLENINNNLDNNPDLVRFQIRQVGNSKIEYHEKPFKGLNGSNAFYEICKYHFVENAWSYAYKKDFYTKNKFYFKPNMIHEDFGLIPLVILKSHVVNSIDYIGYNYVQRNNSIMNDKNYEKALKKANDVFLQYLDIVDKSNDKYYKSFLANSLILKLKDLNKKDYKSLLKKLREYKVFDNLLDNTMQRKIKKIIIKISPKFYLKRM